ncbi:hypothetical protein BH10BDE1_BH10BDE1_00250 [soil metagenome]
MTRNFLSLTLSVLFAAAVLAGCSRSALNAGSSDSVAMDSKEITAQNYRDHKVMIDLDPGNRNPKLSWATLYSEMPGDEPVEDRKKDEAQNTSIMGRIKKFVGGKSTKKTFANWKDDPAALKVELDRRFTKVMRSILKDKALKAEFLAAAKNFNVDPILALGCIVGENTFNVTPFDDAGTYAIRAAMMADKWALRFRSNEIDLSATLKNSLFDQCTNPKDAGGSHAEYWDCVGAVWSKSFMGKSVDGVKYPMQGFKWLFFNPLGTGYSYGLGQLDPIRALMVTDMVHKKSGLRLVTVDRPEEIYEDIIDPKTTVHYVMANVRLMLDRYASGANFDVSRNPGVIASLYNLGGEKYKAGVLYRKNLESLKKGVLVTPVENYYGFYINEKEALMRQAFERWAL